MNIQVQMWQGSTPRPLKLTVNQFWYLKQNGAFSDYSKSELIYGEMSGVPLQDDDEPESDASVPIKLRAKDYLSLVEAGLLNDAGRTELIDGVLYEMSPQHRPHWYLKNELTYRLRRALEEIESQLFVGSEGSVALSDFDLPEPDVVVTDEPLGNGPIPVASVHLLVEIADTTGSHDLGIKARTYAAAGVPEYWVVDLPNRQTHQFWAPTIDGYAETRRWRFGERLGAKTLPLAIDLPE